MRIVVTHRTRGVGAEGVHVLGMVEAFRSAGHDVVVDCLPGCDPSENCLADPARAIPDRHHPGSVSRIARWVYHLIADHSPQVVFGLVELIYNLPLLIRLSRKLRVRPDLVYERYAVGTFAPALLCWLRRIPLVLEVNDSVIITRSRPTTFRRIKFALEAWILARSTLIITVTEHFKARLRDQFPQIPAARIMVLPNAVAWHRFEETVQVNLIGTAIRNRLGLGDRVLIGTTGQFLAWHGLSDLVAATASLAIEQNLGYLFVGDGPVQAEVKREAHRAGVADRITFTGMISQAEVPNHLALLDAAVIPACNEHCSPMKLIEFMALGLPVVAPDLPNIREVVCDRQTGRLFRPGDMGHLRQCLMDILTDKKASLMMGQRARNHVFTELTWSSHARKILDALTNLRMEVEGEPCIS